MLYEEGEGGYGCTFFGICVCDEEVLGESEVAGLKGGDGNVGLIVCWCWQYDYIFVSYHVGVVTGCWRSN